MPYRILVLRHLPCRKVWYNEEKAFLPASPAFQEKSIHQFMSPIMLLPDLPGCSVEQMSQTEEAIVIIAPLLVAPRAQRTSSVQELLRVIGEAMGGEAGTRLSQRLAMKCSSATVLRLVRQAPLPSSSTVRVVGVDEWAVAQRSMLWDHPG
jgi:hypothetical protein